MGISTRTGFRAGSCEISYKSQVLIQGTCYSLTRHGDSGALSGILFVVTTIGGLLLTARPNISLNPESPAGSIADVLTGNSSIISIGISLALIGAFFFLWFLSYMRESIQAVEGEKNRLSSVVFGSGLVIVVLILVLGSFGLAEITPSNYGIDTQVAKTFFIYSWGFVEVLSPPAVAMIAAVTVASLLYKAFPQWFSLFGAVFTVISIVTFLFIPGFATVLLMVWVVVTSSVLYTHRRKMAK